MPSDAGVVHGPADPGLRAVGGVTPVVGEGDGEGVGDGAGAGADMPPSWQELSIKAMQEIAVIIGILRIV